MKRMVPPRIGAGGLRNSLKENTNVYTATGKGRLERGLGIARGWLATAVSPRIRRDHAFYPGPRPEWGVLTAEVFDDNERIVVRLEAPGLDGKDFDIHVHDDYLVVSGEKHIERESNQGRYHVTECA